MEEKDEPEQIEIQENVENSSQRVCIRCKSSANFFASKRHKTCVDCCNKTKRVMSEKQMENFARAREIRASNIQRRKDLEAQIKEEEKNKYEDKIVKKAVSIKKKQLLKIAQLDEDISDEDTPLEEVREISKKASANKKRTSKPVRQREPEYEPVERPQKPVRTVTEHMHAPPQMSFYIV